MTPTLDAAKLLKDAWAAIVQQVVDLGPCSEEDRDRIATGFAVASDQSPKSMIQKFRAIQWCLSNVKLKPEGVAKLGQEKTLSSYRRRNEGHEPAFEGRKAWLKMYPASQHSLLNAQFERIRAIAEIRNSEDECDWLISHFTNLSSEQIRMDAQNLKGSKITGQS